MGAWEAVAAIVGSIVAGLVGILTGYWGYLQKSEQKQRTEAKLTTDIKELTAAANLASPATKYHSRQDVLLDVMFEERIDRAEIKKRLSVLEEQLEAQREEARRVANERDSALKRAERVEAERDRLQERVCKLEADVRSLTEQVEHLNRELDHERSGPDAG